MTFLEAAIEILRRADGAMHFSEIARRAVDENLLSHVGRDPEAAMRTCLTSAVRGEPSIVVREKPGFYALREGAELPPSPEPPAAPVRKANSEDGVEANDSGRGRKTVRRRGGSRKDSKSVDDEDKRDADDDGDEDETARSGSRARKGPRRRGGRSNRTRPPVQAVEAREPEEQDLPPAKTIEFEAPSGSGLEGVTDVALVMANAMSRLVEERPELRGELEAMQQQGQPPAQAQPERASSRSTKSIAHREERSNRRRRRRRRRGKRVEWSAGAEDRELAAANLTESLLDAVEAVLIDAGPRSLHVRQIAESVANKGLLGGEISEIERAITSAILMDVHAHGRASRFVARGDARYQLHGTRLPDPVAKAERAARQAIRTLERETSEQLERWLHSLGARALESLVRIYMQVEGYTLVAAMPPARGIGKLLVEDPDSEDDGRMFVLVIPRRTGYDPKLWEGEAEKNECQSVLIVSMGDTPEDPEPSDARVLGASEFAEWLRERNLGVKSTQFTVTMLDPDFIESIGGLDT